MQPRCKKSVAERKASFAKLLNTYFKKVRCIDASEYVPSMSDDYDVTVIDGTPKALKPEQIIRDEAGNAIEYHKAQYLPDDFSRPMITIANASDDMGREIGTKLDWYCLCLDAEAHSTNLDHPIFKGPYKFRPKLVKKPTPAAAFEYAMGDQASIPDSVMMWAVQTKGYGNTPDYRIGMVSRDDGFYDSPDVEFISSGVCAKSIGAVAIGRHGNFMTWGFSAPPADMTDAGKVAFVNAIIYMKQFAGQTPIARKYNDRIITRDNVRLFKYLLTEDAYRTHVQAMEESQKLIAHMQDSLRQVKANGGDIGEMEAYLSIPSRPIPTRAEYMREYGYRYDVFGNDPEMVADYLDRNLDYLYPSKDGFSFDLDTDAKVLGVANNDKRILDRAITMLEQGQDTAMAHRILTRYTLCRFTTPQQWRQWYNRWQDKLFFTEAGGWLFLVNSRDADVVGNDYSVLRKPQQPAQSQGNAPAPVAPQLQETSNSNPVAVTAFAEGRADGDKDIVVRVRIHPGYHIYANVDDADPYIETTMDITVPDNYKKNRHHAVACLQIVERREQDHRL